MQTGSAQCMQALAIIQRPLDGPWRRKRGLLSCVAAHARTHETQEPLSVEYRLIAKDGRVVWIRDEGVVVFDEDGRPLYLQGYLLDITAEREAQDQLRQMALYDTLTAWYFKGGNGMVLAENTRNIYLTAKQNLICRADKLQPHIYTEWNVRPEATLQRSGVDRTHIDRVDTQLERRR